eukprot:s1043_g30.t1
MPAPLFRIEDSASQARAASYEMCSELASGSCDRQKTCTVILCQDGHASLSSIMLSASQSHQKHLRKVPHHTMPTSYLRATVKMLQGDEQLKHEQWLQNHAKPEVVYRAHIAGISCAP